jgi:hypothetical protein
LEIALQNHISTKPHVSANGNDEDGEPEFIWVTLAIAQRLMLARFPNSPREPYWMPTKVFHPCPTCKFPVAVIRLGLEVKLVDCVENEFSRRWWNRWECDVINSHSCGLGGRQ